MNVRQPIAFDSTFDIINAFTLYGDIGNAGVLGEAIVELFGVCEFKSTF